MQAHRLRRAEIIRVTQDSDACAGAIHVAADVAPASAGFVSFDAIGFAFGCQEKSFILAVPRPITANAQSAIVIFRKFQGTGRRALLGGDEIKHPVTGRSTTDVVKGDLPGFVQSNPGFRRGQIDETMARLEAAVDWTAPGFLERDEFNRAFAFTHVPEIGLAPFKLCLCPRKPDAVVMEVIRRIVVSDEFAGGREDGMKVTTAFEDRFDVGPRQFAHFSLVIKDRLFADGAFEPAASTGNLHACGRIGLQFRSDQPIGLNGSAFEVFFDEARLSFVVDLNWNQVAALVLQLVEGARVGGQSEADNRIAAIIVAGKNRDPAR